MSVDFHMSQSRYIHTIACLMHTCLCAYSCVHVHELCVHVPCVYAYVVKGTLSTMKTCMLHVIKMCKVCSVVCLLCMTFAAAVEIPLSDCD